jgi:hypothetical protein
LAAGAPRTPSRGLDRDQELNAAIGDSEKAIVAEARKLVAPERVVPPVGYGAPLARASAATGPWLKPGFPI